MKCVVCCRQIGRREPKSYIGALGKRKYGCNECNQSKRFDKWIDALPSDVYDQLWQAKETGL